MSIAAARLQFSGGGRQIERVRRLHAHDVASGAGWVELPNALARKYRNAGRELIYTHVLNRGPAAVRSPADALLGGFPGPAPAARSREAAAALSRADAQGSATACRELRTPK